MRQNNYTFSLVSVLWLIPHEEFSPKRFEEVHEEIENANGYEWAIIADRATGVILDGHHRHQVALYMNLTRVPVILVDYLEDNNILVEKWSDNSAAADDEEEEDETSSPNSNTTLSTSSSSLGKHQHRFSSQKLSCSFPNFFLNQSYDESGVVKVDSIEKQSVIQKALARSLYPPKTTRHGFPSEFFDLQRFTSLDELRSAF